jgi:predicted nucleotide-binding protein
MAKDLLAPDSLHSFLVASRTRSQSEILKMFLHTAIKQNAVAEAGSIHIYNPVTNKLYLFNDDQFLYKQGFLDRGPDWKETFDPWEGLAGAAFGKRQIQWTNNVDQEPKFTQTGGAVPIKTIACAPILFSEQRVPFGVASFHNDEAQGAFDQHRLKLIELYVETLAVTLRASRDRMSVDGGAKVFIVHGRDDLALSQLRLALSDRGVEPVVLKSRPKTGPEILEMLENEISGCSAGFVLLTPDDEGRLRKDAGKPDPLKPRVRENVMFESGYLVAQFQDMRRVCFLLKQPLELPSDLKGLLYESFETIDGSLTRIEAVLEEWKLIPRRPEQRRDTPPRSQ